MRAPAPLVDRFLIMIKLEVAQQMANHESARTTGLYGRGNDAFELDEVERMVYEKVTLLIDKIRLSTAPFSVGPPPECSIVG